jgi:hypothetical protein
VSLPQQVKAANDLRLVRLREARHLLGDTAMMPVNRILPLFKLLLEDAITLGEMIRLMDETAHEPDA